MRPEIAILFSAISAIAAVSGIVVGWAARAREGKREAKQDAAMSATLRSDLEYIRRAVDDMRIEIHAQGISMNSMNERLIRNEESTKRNEERIKQAHMRLDRHDEMIRKE